MSKVPRLLFAGTLCLGLGASRAAAQSTRDSLHVAGDSAAPRSLGAVKVVGRVDELMGVASSASEGRVGAVQLRLRPLMREGELLETVPGLIVSQHSGDGKANQYFVRGFNLDHGTDFQVQLDGMPVNAPTHAHGQGYTDLNFLIPEFVERVDYRLGVHHASQGDFGSAGGAEFHLATRLPGPFASVEGGRFGYSRVVTGASTAVGGGTLLAGGELKGYDGPWAIAEQLRKRSGLLRWTRGAPTSQVSVLAMSYASAWRASDQVPLRAITAGTIDRFGQVDPGLGGRSERHSLSASGQRIGAHALQQVQLFGVRSRLDLTSNFTYGLADATHGDQFNQREARTMVGANATHRQALGAAHRVTVGVQHRTDLVDGLGLYRTAQRHRLGTVREDDVTESSTGGWVEVESRWTSRVRSTLGLRGDAYTFHVRGDRAENGGRRRDAIASPKASLAWALSNRAEFYLSGGLGFHSNDARGTTITVDPATGDPARRVDPLVRSRGAEVGLRAMPARTWSGTLTAWGLDLDSELLFVGDGGTTEPADRSRRLGITASTAWHARPGLSLDADVSLAHARFTAGDRAERRIPGALERVVAAGVTWGGTGRGPFGALRLRHVGAYPLVEDNAVRATASTLVNGEVGVQLARVRLQATLLNLLGSTARDIQYFYASRLPGEPAEGVGDVHLHPVEPRQLRVAVRWGR